MNGCPECEGTGQIRGLTCAICQGRIPDSQSPNEMIRAFGFQAQALQLQEEMAEAMVAFNHFRRGRAGEDPLVEELADVWLCVSQFAEHYGERFTLAVARKDLKRQGALQRRLIDPGRRGGDR